MVPGKKWTPHLPADPDGSQKISHTFNYNTKTIIF